MSCVSPFRPALIVLCVFSLLCAGCSTAKKEKDKNVAPVEDMYNKAADTLDQKDYVEAAKQFEDVQREYPYSRWSQLAQMMAGYAYYELQDYDSAIATLQDFIDLHPGHERVDYAMYLIGLSYYEQISDIARDQDMTSKALQAFEALIARFPESRYTRDVKLKRDLTRDHLAGKEMEIGRYYLTRGEYNAAINRFRKVVADYQTTTHIPEALHRLVECYTTLGLRDEAVRVAAVLGHNFPGSKWYARSYQLLDPALRKQLDTDRGYFDRTIEGWLKPD